MFLEAVGGCFVLVNDADCRYVWHSSLRLGISFTKAVTTDELGSDSTVTRIDLCCDANV